MPDKITKTCSNCETKYNVTWDSEEHELQPLTCPFCGYEVENEEEEVEWVNKNEEEDNWN
jgi:hydrogenase maturation factor HypF (carbamoyltransferase family)